MLAQRLLSAFLGLAIIMPAIIYSHLAVQALVLVAIGVCLYEFFGMALPDSLPPIRSLVTVLGIWFGASLIFLGSSQAASIIFVTLLLSFCIYLFLEKRTEKIPLHLGLALLGFVYIGFTLPHFVFLHRVPHGHLWVFWVLAGTFIGDSGAYTLGRLCGKHKIFPRISPKKTWEGFAGQLIGAGLGTFLWWALFMKSFASLQDAVAVGLICGFLAPLGDLGESMLKRAFGVKDSGRFMPGHGGLLDRVDALLFTGPAVYTYFQQVY